MPSADSVLVLSGGFGVGKSTVLDHVGDELARRGRPFALMDLDWFHRSWPTPEDDPDNGRIETENVAAVWRRYRAAGPRQPVVAGVVRGPRDVDRLEEAFGAPLRVVLLTATDTTVEARLRHRYRDGRAAALDWHLQRFRDVAHDLERAGCHHAAVATDDRTPLQVALDVLERMGIAPGAAGG